MAEDLTVGKQLKLRRVLIGARQWVVAAKANLSQNMLSEIERDRIKCTPEVRARIEQALLEIKEKEELNGKK